MLTAHSPLATVEDVELLHGPVADEDRDQVSRLHEVASAAVCRFCRQTLTWVEDDDVTFVADGTATLLLGQRPVLSVSEVGAQCSGSKRLATRTDFSFDSFGNLIRTDGLRWGRRYDPVRVIYSRGDDPVPDDPAGRVVAKVSTTMAAGAANLGGLKSLQVGATSESYANVAGSAGALDCGVLTEEEREALRAASYRLTAWSLSS